MKRDEVVSKLKILKSEIEWDYSLEDQIVIDEAISMIMEQKMGKWIKYGERWGDVQAWECSICKNHYDINTVYTKMPYNYCPNCGAKMAESEDKE